MFDDFIRPGRARGGGRGGVRSSSVSVVCCVFNGVNFFMFVGFWSSCYSPL